MAWIEPFEFQTWIVNVFSGNPEIFFAISLIAIIGMAAYFKMTQLTMFLMMGIFTLIFRDFIPPSITTFFMLITALVLGFVLNKIMNRT